MIFPDEMSDDARTPVFGGPPLNHYHENQYGFPPHSAPTRHANGPKLVRMQSKLQECEENQCAEEGCDPEECGDENRAPSRERDTYCGVDSRPLLPLGLIGSTIFSFIVVVRVHIPSLARSAGDEFFPSLFFVPLYLVTILSMVYTALSDPGQLHHDQMPMQADGQRTPPRRSHKSWLYSYPIRRYDHYCRWVMNVIGLLNHRAFFIMCAGLQACVGIGSLVDIVLILEVFVRSSWRDLWVLLAHLAYCCIVIGLLGPIFKLHVGFVSRNELAQEWTKNHNYVAFSAKRGGKIPVNDMNDDEFNDAFDFFEYDPKRNPWDKGTYNNCITFWFHSRDETRQMGEF